MDAKKSVNIAITIFVLVFLVFSSFYFFKYPIKMTGFTIYTNQPNSTTGKDTYLRQNSGINYGTAQTMKIGKTAQGDEYRALIEFNLSAVPSGDTIVLATLQVYSESPTASGNMTLKVYRVTYAWNETATNWTYRTPADIWWSSGGDYNSEQIASVDFTNVSGAYYNFTITSLVSNWTRGTSSNYGLIIIASNISNGDIMEISSSNSATASQRPLLFVNHQSNTAPAINNLTTNSSLSSPKAVGQNVTFSVSWTDLESDNGQIFICNSSSVSISGCGSGTFCNTTLAQTNPATCSYTAVGSNNRTTEFWGVACDGSNCSDANNSRFYMNHLPTVGVNQPNGGETINQSSQGNYNIQFNISDADSDYLTASLHYGPTQNSTASLINSSVNLTSICTDPDSNTATTPNNCQYAWNTTGIYGTYFLTVTVNDSYHTSSDSSDSSFNVRSLSEVIPPNITAQWKETGTIYSGKQIQFYANASDQNINTVWISVNGSSQANYTMLNSTSITFNYTWTATEAGSYRFKVWANDSIGNTNNSMAWENFSVVKPNATTQNETGPSSALPYHTIQITGKLNATNPLANVYAYLNAHEGFTFLSNYSQNSLKGNFTANQTKTATWFLGTPITEGTYIFNITYTDSYSNQWNSSNIQVQITSGIGGYEITTAGYPEIETGNNYYIESYFKQSGAYTNPDSMAISIYDPLGQLTFGPLSMTQESTGIYNYTRNITSGQTEGIWETIVNATKSGTSYYAHEFWKVVGGPFDVRTITVIDSGVSELNISFIAENTGGANKDLILAWNLTREDTGAVLDTGAETKMVPANSQITWYISPSTSYIGQVRITLLGYYSGTEKAGAYKVFSTTSAAETPATSTTTSGGGGGGGGTPIEITKTVNITIPDYEEEITLAKNIEKTVKLVLYNSGEAKLTNISLSLENFEKGYYTVNPSFIESLSSKKNKEIEVKFLVTDFTGEKETNYIVQSGELTKKFPLKIIVLNVKDYFLEKIKDIKEQIIDLKYKIQKDSKESLLPELDKCSLILDGLESMVSEENFIEAEKELKVLEKCVGNVEKEYDKQPIIIVEKIKGYWMFIVVGILVLASLGAMIGAIIAVIHYLNKKIKLARFIKDSKGQEINQKITEKDTKDKFVDDKLQSLKNKLRGGKK